VSARASQSRSAMVIAALALGLIASEAGAAAAQGRSGGAPGKVHQPRPGGGAPATTPGSPTPAVASLTTWLDDTTPLMKGEMWLGLSVAHWKTDDARTLFAPIVFTSGGLSSRVSAGATAPVYHQRDSSGNNFSGFGDVTFFGKLSVRDPATHRFGLAFTPVVVVYQSPDSARRAAWAMPISLERRASRGRVYGSAGYFSSGAIFGNAAADAWLGSRLSAGVVFGATRRTKTESTNTLVSRHRIDLSGTVSITATRKFALFGSIGKSFTGAPALDGGPWIAGGILIRHVAAASRGK
jgi:hypothetical protein